jgi:hypothetical protein
MLFNIAIEEMGRFSFFDKEFIGTAKRWKTQADGSHTISRYETDGKEDVRGGTGRSGRW